MASLLDGKKVSSELREELKRIIEDVKKDHPSFKPGLAIVQVGERADSTVYVNTKCKSANEIGMEARHVKLPKSVSQQEVLSALDQLNKDENIHGIIVQLPLDCTEQIDADLCTNSVLPEKDVDGLHDINAGRLARGQLGNCFIPCTPRGCMKLIDKSGIDIKGKHAVVIGRSKIVGSPMANLLTWSHATVTICHSKTQNLPDIVKQADILVVACGQLQLVKGEWIKEGAVVIDCGINVVKDETKKSGKRLVGDVDFEEAKKKASWITPVPGGVGPMTVGMLLQNTVENAKRRLEKSIKNGNM